MLRWLAGGVVVVWLGVGFAPQPVTYPPELSPLQPTIQVLWAAYQPPQLDLPSAPPGEPIDQLVLGPANVFSGQAELDTFCADGSTRANGTYAESDHSNPTRVRLTCVFLPTYNAPNNMSTELQQLQQNALGATPWPPTPGVPPVPAINVDALRTQTHADRVTLIDGDGGSCGLAYMNASVYGKTWAFSVVNKICLSNSSLHHEWGHNDGLCHDDANAVGCTPAKPYGYGYCDPLTNAKSPMAYPLPCNKQRTIFSNVANVWTYGHPYGDATHDEAAVQRWAMPIEAAFLPSGPVGPINHVR